MKLNSTSVPPFRRLVLLWAVILPALIACSNSAILEEEVVPAPTLEMARQRSGEYAAAVSRDLERFAPECIAAARYHEQRAAAVEQQDPEQARAEYDEAARYFSEAAAVTAAVRGRRELQFPPDSVGEVLVRSWDGKGNWRVPVEAQGTVVIEPEMEARLQVHPEFGDQDVEVLLALSPGAIQSLNLSGSQITDEGLQSLPRLPGLHEISLHNTKIGDAGLARVGALKHLRQLNLLHTKVTDAGIEALAFMPALEELAISDAPITDRALLSLRTPPKLHTLMLMNAELSDVGVDFIVQKQSLRTIWISGRGITDFAIPLFAQLEDLEQLTLLHTSVSDAGFRQLQARLPSSKVSRL